ncbi:MAG: O-antigen ligase family protein [Lentisphaerae bacterium]|nr:O-antigen ligase family protein [Lentisphaerota bacterium]
MKRLSHALVSIAAIGALLTLIISPTQIGFTTKQGGNICFADLLLLPVAAVWALGVIVGRRWLLFIPAPPSSPRTSIWRLWPQLLLPFLALTSIAVAANRAEAVKESIQLTLYLVVASFIFYDFLKTGCASNATAQTLPATYKRIVWLLLALLLPLICHLSAAALQYLTPTNADLNVRGLFGNRNVLGGWLALTIPLTLGAAISARRWWVWLLAATAIIATLTLNLAGASYIATALALIFVARRHSTALFIAAGVILIAWQCLVLPRLPRENDLAHFRTIALYNSEGSPERRYPEWQAATALLLTHPLRGTGGGNYQREIGRYYDVVPNATGPSEPDIQNLYLVFAATMGLPGLLTLIAIFANAGFAAGRATANTSRHAGLAAGVAGSIGAFAATAMWHPLIVRGIGLPLAAILALAYTIGDITSDDTSPIISEV